MLRGWKRAGEIADASIRFHFLMKICEVSIAMEQYKQAFAVLREIHEPEGKRELRSYLIIACKVYCANGDLQQALKTFKRACDGETFAVAVRVYGLLLFDLKKAGGLEAAKKITENMSSTYNEKIELQMLDECVANDREKVRTPEEIKMMIIKAGVAVFLLFLFLILWWV